MDTANQCFAFAINLAKKAGRIQMRHLDKPHSFEYSDINDLKTEVDQKIAKLVRLQIERTFPDHNICAEESSAKITGHRLTWVVDELDGTNPFAWGFSNHFSFCVALYDGVDPIFGIVNAPARNELFSAITGQGAFCNGVRIRVNSLDDLSKTWVAADPGKMNRTSIVPYITKIWAGLAGFLTYGCASVPLCLIAKGNFHAYLATGLNPEDAAACVPIIREAGGRVTNLKGEEWKLGDASILAANPVLHQKLSEFFGLPKAH